MQGAWSAEGGIGDREVQNDPPFADSGTGELGLSDLYLDPKDPLRVPPELDCINPNPLDVSSSQRGLQSLFTSLKSQIHGNSGSKDRDEYLLSTAMCKKLYTRHLFNPKRAYEEDTVILSCLSYK